MIALGLRALLMFVRYILQSPLISRFHVESSILIFVVVGVLLVCFVPRSADDETVAADAFPIWIWVAFCAVAAVLYLPSLSIGYLSDDYVLIDRAYRSRIDAFNAIAFRPLPLLVWAVALQIGGGPTMLHLINVVLHGTNAHLASRLARPLLKDTGRALLAGLLVLTSPIAPEAVAWCSGVSDVAATSFMLAMILVARGYDVRASAQRRTTFGVLAMAAILSKEVAAIGPLLVLTDAWARRGLSRKLIVDSALLCGLFVIYGIVRTADTGVRQPITKYMLQRAVFGTFGSLANPWHIDVVRAWPWIPIIYATLILAILMWCFAQKEIPTSLIRTATAGAAWTLIAVLPTVTFIVIGPDL